MNKYIICCESTADLTREHFIDRNIAIAHFTYSIDGKEYIDDFGVSMPLKEFYDKMRAGAITGTSQISVQAYEDRWRSLLEEGYDIIHITLSSGISGTYNSASVAAEELRDEYKGRKIEVIDSRTASAGYGLLVDMAADRRDEGYSFEELVEYIKDKRHYINGWFFTTDLTYLCRGGRVSKTAFVLGTALKVCPLLRISYEGKLLPAAKCRGKNKVIQATAECVRKLAAGGREYDGYCYIIQADDMEVAEKLRAQIESDMPKLVGKVKIFDIGTAIGSHTGPGTVGVFFDGAKKEV